MCGIAGFIDFNRQSSQEVLERQTEVIRHRGPNGSGTRLFASSTATIGLGHRRLSIIDLSDSGNQPMSRGNLHIVFNGEIYNFREIKAKLEKGGHRFASASDTEVILVAYQEWGISALDKFVGMFSFVLYDTESEELILVRDRAGTKPLYYYYADGLFLFGSELKSFHVHPSFSRELDLASAKLFFQFGYIPAPYSIFKNTFKLEPGHLLKININNGEIHKQPYWNVLDFYNKPKRQISVDEAISELEPLLHSAFSYRMVSDVPVGIFLSGGYDSSCIAAILQKDSLEKIKTFTIGFHESQFNEAKYARQVADYLGTDHHEHFCSIGEAKSIIPDLPQMFDEPFGDSSAIPTALVSKIAANHVKVALSADAGDEIFGGYNSYFYFCKLYRRFAVLPPALRKLLAFSIPAAKFAMRPLGNQFYNSETRFSKLPDLLGSSNPSTFNMVLNQYFSRQEVDSLVLNAPEAPQKTSFLDYVNPEHNDFMSLQLGIGYKTFLVDDILTKVDRATMSVGLEGREPFLDHRLIEYVAQLPSNIKNPNGVPKWLLKQITHKYIPRELIDRPKMGFSIPVEEWLKGDLAYLLEEYLAPTKVRIQGILNWKETEKIRSEFLAGKQFNFSKVWFLLMFQMWYERWAQI